MKITYELEVTEKGGLVINSVVELLEMMVSALKGEAEPLSFGEICSFEGFTVRSTYGCITTTEVAP